MTDLEQLTPPEQAATALQFLRQAVQPPQEIDAAYIRGDIDPGRLVMTSMGNQRRALLTPYFSGMEFHATLPARIERARAHDRPLVEAVVRYSRPKLQAVVTLRQLFGSPGDLMLESAWKYPLAADPTRSTTWDVIAAIQTASQHGQAVPARSGVVNVTHERLNSVNWALTRTVAPPEAITILADSISQAPFTSV